jgi:hypothetical protein
MRFIIDRFEGGFAIVELENREIVNIPRVVLPIEAKEGDSIIVSIDEVETESRKKRIQDKFNSLFDDGE